MTRFKEVTAIDLRGKIELSDISENNVPIEWAEKVRYNYNLELVDPRQLMGLWCIIYNRSYISIGSWLVY